ncbi:hypothetical protein LEP1GSC115_3526 [Leptospira interrogans serovar Australis str. 200703203]|uniref:Uncharacterized protein n=1 Tax=Leptospira interrogans serovar Australis str. 200703203 TaxID=1085541 RepID=N1UDA3_LEPIR|nr:hypothetical protein LEP1GSC115_3526 [Leptospira interrogans serovar Australis str. 200703203]
MLNSKWRLSIFSLKTELKTNFEFQIDRLLDGTLLEIENLKL